MAQASRMVVGNRPLQEVAHHLVVQVREVLGAEACVLRELDCDHLNLLASVGVPVGQLQPTIPAHEGIAARVLSGGKPMLIHDVESFPTPPTGQADSSASSNPFVFRSYAGAPLIAGGRVLGVIAVYHVHGSQEFSSIDLEHLEIVAYNVAVALVNQRLYNDLREANLFLKEQVLRAEQAERQVILGAFNDALTGLPNRAMFTQHLQHCIDRSRRDPFQFHVMHLDLDRFKYVNDSLGHAAGDRVLLSVVSAVKATLRPGDLLARLAGDEFALLLEEVDGVDDVINILNRIRSGVARVHEVGDLEIYTSVSIGLVHGGPHYELADEVLRDAETAMYHAKTVGKNSYAIFRPELLEHVRRLFDVETELRKHLDRGAMDVEFQPIVATNTANLAGFEALARWNHPVFGVISPSDFIAVAEETGMIHMLGELVLQRSCAEATTWPKSPDGQFPYVTVNLSAYQLMHAGLPDLVRRVLGETGLDPGRLRLELTESVLLQRPEEALSRLQELRQLGVRVVIDDFGTGYSSLSYLDCVPAEGLKIDRSFVMSIHPGARPREVMPAIVSLAHAMNLSVIAEGVETAHQYQVLRAMGCDFIQGHVIARAMSAEAALDFAAKSPTPLLAAL